MHELDWSEVEADGGAMEEGQGQQNGSHLFALVRPAVGQLLEASKIMPTKLSRTHTLDAKFTTIAFCPASCYNGDGGVRWSPVTILP